MGEQAGMDERIDRAKHGEKAALHSLVIEHYPRVYRFCARRLGDDLGQDSAQETFITMQKQIKRYEAKSSFETWLLGIAHNQCRNLARKRRRDPISLDYALEVGGADHSGQVADNQVLRSALAQLSDEHREVVLMHEIEGMTYLEISQVVGVPEGTVKSRLYHAFKNLREGMEEARA